MISLNGAITSLTRTRRRIETVIAKQFQVETIRACDLWHLTSRLARKVLAYTLGLIVNCSLGRLDLQFTGLIVA